MTASRSTVKAGTEVAADLGVRVGAAVAVARVWTTMRVGLRVGVWAGASAATDVGVGAAVWVLTCAQMKRTMSSAARMSATTMTITVMRDIAGHMSAGWLARDSATGGAGGASGGCGTYRGGYSQTMPSLSPSLREFS